MRPVSESHATPIVPDLIVGDAEAERISGGLSRATRWRLAKVGAFPQKRMLTTARSGYLLSELLDWIRSRPVVGTNALAENASDD